MKKIILILSCIVILTAVYLIYDYHQPKRMIIGYNGIIYSNESTFEKESSIHIEGDLYKNLFAKDLFIGKLIVDNDLKRDIKLNKMDNKYIGLLTSDSDNGFIKSIGSVMASSNFDKAWIQLNEINERYNIIEGYISGPARTKEEAKVIARRVLEGKP